MKSLLDIATVLQTPFMITTRRLCMKRSQVHISPEDGIPSPSSFTSSWAPTVKWGSALNRPWKPSSISCHVRCHIIWCDIKVVKQTNNKYIIITAHVFETAKSCSAGQEISRPYETWSPLQYWQKSASFPYPEPAELDMPYINTFLSIILILSSLSCLDLLYSLSACCFHINIFHMFVTVFMCADIQRGTPWYISILEHRRVEKEPIKWLYEAWSFLLR